MPEAVKVNEVLKRFIHLSCFLLVLAGPAQAQLPESEGPYSAEVRNIRFEDTRFDRKQIRARVYWPTLREGDEKASETPFGPFPLVGFMHGWTGSPWHYDALSLHLASWGFIVASIGTETERDGNLKDEARDTQALMHWIASRSEEPEVWLSGMVAPGDWGAPGHSMGGGACLELIRIEPKVRVIAPLQPWIEKRGKDAKAILGHLGEWTGRSWFIAGQLDKTCPPKMVRSGFDSAISASRNFWTEVTHMGHLGPINHPPSHSKLTSKEKVRVHKRILGGFFRAELRGEEDLYHALLGPSSDSESLNHEARCSEPVVWWENGALAVASLPGQEIQAFGSAHMADEKGMLRLKPNPKHAALPSVQISAGDTKSRVLSIPRK